MMFGFKTLILVGCLILLSIRVLAQQAVTPMAQVINLLDAQGGSRSGQTDEDGFYIVVVAFSSEHDEYKAFELARLDALRQLNDSVNGSIISGHAQATINYDSDSPKTRQTFSEVVSDQFKGAISAARVLKKGLYHGEYFVAMVLAQQDVNNANVLKTPLVAKTFADTYTDDVEVNRVTAKGMASMKNGMAKGRMQAIEDAIRNAVQQAKGVMVSGRSGTFNGMLSSALSTKTHGYVRSYVIVDESQSNGNFAVTINAQVDTGQLLRDVNFYLSAFNSPRFRIETTEPAARRWLQPRLEELGFKITTHLTNASHTFVIEQHQSQAVAENNYVGFKTRVLLTLVDVKSGEVLLTLSNDENKTIYRLSDVSSAKAASLQAAYQLLAKTLDKDIITALATIAQRGQVYQISVINAKRSDLALFKHSVENGANGTIEHWEWDGNNQHLTLFYRYKGSFTEAVDSFLPTLYANYQTLGKGRRPKAVTLTGDQATFRILQ